MVVHVVSSAYWMWKDTAPPTWDSASHNWIALNLLEEVKGFDLWGVLTASDYYPILTHLLAGVGIVLSGGAVYTGTQVVSLVFLLLSVLGTYWFVKEVTKDERVAVISAVLYSLFPIVYGEAKTLKLDVPLVFWVTLALTMLLKSKRLSKARESLWFFVVLGLAMMTKWMGVVFVGIPLLYVVKEVWVRLGKEEVVKRTKGLVVTSLIVGPWYVVNLGSWLRKAAVYGAGETKTDPVNLLSIKTWVHYLEIFINRQVTPVGALLILVAGCVLVGMWKFGGSKEIKKRSKRVVWWILYVLILYVVFTVLKNKDPRYTMPALPMVAMILGMYLVWLIDWYRWVGLVVSGLVLIYFLVYLVVVVVRPGRIEGYELAVKLPIVGWTRIIDISDKLVEKHDDQDWRVDRLLDDLTELSGKKKIRVEVGVDYNHFNAATLNAEEKIREYIGGDGRVEFTAPDVFTLFDMYGVEYFPSSEEIESYLAGVDYYLMTWGEVGPFYIRNIRPIDQIRYGLLGGEFRFCADYIEKEVEMGGICYVREGEVVKTRSDVELYSGVKVFDERKGETMISGFERVKCPWGCSFVSSDLKEVNQDQFGVRVSLVKGYGLPNGQVVRLYKIER